MTAREGEIPSIGRRTLLATAMAAVGLGCVARAHIGDGMLGEPVDLQVVDRETGQPLRVWRHDGRLFVAGRPGARYGLRVTNRTDGRVLVVMSVDGVNILTGETAGYGQRGYVFVPYESFEIEGWRKTLAEVADFTFAPLPQSYAARTGRPAEVGVIGIAVFTEKVEVDAAEAGGAVSAPLEQPRLAMRAPPPPPAAPAKAAADKDAGGLVSELVVAGAKRQSRAQSAPVAVSVFTTKSREVMAAPHRDEKLGTGHGAREWSETTIVPFDRATSFPQFTRQIEYDTYDNLVAMGVIPGRRYGEHHPRPFPSSPSEPGFVPDPPDDP